MGDLHGNLMLRLHLAWAVEPLYRYSNSINLIGEGGIHQVMLILYIKTLSVLWLITKSS